MKTQKNQDVRNYAKEHGVMFWEISERLRISEGNFSRKMRHELDDTTKQRIYQIIDELAAETNR